MTRRRTWNCYQCGKQAKTRLRIKIHLALSHGIFR